MGQLRIRRVQAGIRGLPLDKIHPAYLNEWFIEVQHMYERAHNVVKGLERHDALDTIGRTKRAIHNIDEYLRDEGVHVKSDIHLIGHEQLEMRPKIRRRRNGAES